MVHHLRRLTVGLVLGLSATAAQAQTSQTEPCDAVCTVIGAFGADVPRSEPPHTASALKPAAEPAPRIRMRARALVAAYGPGMAAP